jgi:acyl-CoA synthetase (AMP-forming)/AMP-acid ligase II
LPTLRYVTQAGGAMSPARIDEWLARGPKAAFYVMYGATEGAARLTYLPPDQLHARRGSIGRPVDGVQLRVLTDAGTVAAVGEVGELVASGENIAAGYWNRPAETAERFGPLGYRTGDLGYVDADGYFFITGRRHDMIKVGANRVGAREIEDVLLCHEAVTESAVVPVADDLLGEAPVAVVSLATPLQDAERELRGFCAARLAAYKVPVRVLVVADLPKLPGSGKLDRVSLRSMAARQVDDTRRTT